MRPWFTKQGAIPLGMALVIFAALLVVQHARNRTDSLSIQWRNREIELLLTPSAFGLVNWAEVYQDELFEFRSSEYQGSPFDPAGVVAEHFPAPLGGFFYFYHYNGGGPHWTLSIAGPLWLSGLLALPLLTRLIPRRPLPTEPHRK